MSPPRVLVAGIGNVFFGDDGFGVEVVDIGIRGVHLAYQLLDGWTGLVLVDAVHRDGPPGTLYRLEHTFDLAPGASAEIAVDGHDMSPDVVLGLLRDLALATGVDAPVGRVLVLGCEPAGTDQGIGLSGPVAAAVRPAMAAVDELVALLLDPVPSMPAGEGVAR